MTPLQTPFWAGPPTLHGPSRLREGGTRISPRPAPSELSGPWGPEDTAWAEPPYPRITSVDTCDPSPREMAGGQRAWHFVSALSDLCPITPMAPRGELRPPPRRLTGRTRGTVPQPVPLPSPRGRRGSRHPSPCLLSIPWTSPSCLSLLQGNERALSTWSH